MEMMLAAQFGRYGGADEISLGSCAKPEPDSGDVRLQVHASSVNGGELLFRRGQLRLLSGRRFPKGLGSDVAGVVDKLGRDADGFEVGDEVWGVLPSIEFVRSQAPAGAAAEYVCVPADRLAPLPHSLSFVEAAALPTVATTALTAVRDVAKIGAGDRVLVRGATGGVGSSVLQLTASRGATVTALTSEANLEAARALGAGEALDYRAIDLSALGRFDAVFDTVGSDLARVRKLVGRGGRMVAMAMNPFAPAARSILASIVHGRERIRFFSGKPGRRLLDELAEEVAADRLKPVIDQVYPLDRVADAHRAAEAGGRCGKQVIDVTHEGR